MFLFDVYVLGCVGMNESLCGYLCFSEFCGGCGCVIMCVIYLHGFLDDQMIGERPS